MSVGNESIDSLSLCPSLIDVLSFVEHKDLTNVQLVSKRMNDVIRRGGSRLDRPRRDLHIVMSSERESGKDFLALFYRCPAFSAKWLRFCITDDRVRQFDSAPMIQDHITANGTRLYNEPHYQYRSILEESKDPAFMHQDIISVNTDKLRDFGVGSIEEGLELLFPPLYQLFFFGDITIRKESRDARSGIRHERWMHMLCDEFKKARSMCRELTTKSEFTEEVKRFQSTLAPSKLSIVYLQETSLSDFLLSQSLEGRLEVVVNRVQFHSPHQLLEIIKRWDSGEISIGNLNIRTQYDFEQYEMVYLEEEFDFSHLDLAAELEGFHIVARDFENEKCKELILKRSPVNQYLHLLYTGRYIDIWEQYVN